MTLIVGGIAALGVIVTWQQKNRADRRSEWWRRVTWALEQTFSDDQNLQELGWSVLETLVGSRLATKDDQRIVLIMSVHVAMAKLTQEDDNERT